MEVERRENIIWFIMDENYLSVGGSGGTKMNETKPFSINRQWVINAYLKVRSNRGSGGVDGVSLKAFGEDYKKNLYRLWTQMSSGSNMPPVKLMEIAKKDGGKRPLGIPTVADHIGQTVVKELLEVVLEPVFHEDSYGYRPGKSAIEDVANAKKRCWRYGWVIDLDIKGFFDNIPHDLLLKAVRKHCDCKWMLLYIERWLVAPLKKQDGEIVARTKGVPQGSVIGPLLANLYLHYCMDVWLKLKCPDCVFERYANNAIIHCHTEKRAEEVRLLLQERLGGYGLELHPVKTKIVYCKESNRKGEYANVTFDFLGYTFQPREAQNKYRKETFTNWLLAVSNKAMKAMNEKMKGWRTVKESDSKLNDVAKEINPFIRGWINYYGKFYTSKLKSFMHIVNIKLARWVRRKYKHLRPSEMKAIRWLAGICKRSPDLFAH